MLTLDMPRVLVPLRPDEHEAVVNEAWRRCEMGLAGSSVSSLVEVAVADAEAGQAPGDVASAGAGFEVTLTQRAYRAVLDVTGGGEDPGYVVARALQSLLHLDTPT